MATRFYLPSTGTPSISPSIDAGWESSYSLIRRNAVTTKISSTMTQITNSSDGSSVNQDICFVQYISAPIIAQTISAQTLKFQMRQYEYASGANLYSTIGVRVLSGDGGTVRGTILAVSRDNTELVVSTLTNRQFSATTTQVVAQNGDIIVIEIGYGGDPEPASQRHQGAISIGDNSATDLPENDTETAAYNPWVEFANTITFEAPNSVTMQDIFFGIPVVDTFEVTLVQQVAPEDTFFGIPVVDTFEVTLVQQVAPEDTFFGVPVVDTFEVTLVQQVAPEDTFFGVPVVDTFAVDQDTNINNVTMQDVFFGIPVVDLLNVTLVQQVAPEDTFFGAPVVDTFEVTLVQQVAPEDIFFGVPVVDLLSVYQDTEQNQVSMQDVFFGVPVVDLLNVTLVQQVSMQDSLFGVPVVDLLNVTLVQQVSMQDSLFGIPVVDLLDVTLVQQLFPQDILFGEFVVDLLTIDQDTSIINYPIKLVYRIRSTSSFYRLPDASFAFYKPLVSFDYRTRED